MAKEYYDATYKTYPNERIKPTLFQGKMVYPLYIQLTYNRKSAVFKSYYFDLFARTKYQFLPTSLPQIERLEGRVIEYIIHRNFDRFDLDRFARQYKLFTIDVLDSFEGAFKLWLINYLKAEDLAGLAGLLACSPVEVSIIKVWDDLKKILDTERFKRMEEMAVQAGPYMPIAMYVRDICPEGPFCLPVYEFAIQKKQMEIERFIRKRFRKADFGQIIQIVCSTLYPDGF